MTNDIQDVAASPLSTDVRVYMHNLTCKAVCCRLRQQETQFRGSQAKNTQVNAARILFARLDLCSCNRIGRCNVGLALPG
jgi:hypothetical protein